MPKPQIRHAVRPRKALQRWLAVLVTVSLGTVALSGCFPTPPGGSPDASGDTALYSGPLPAPAPLPESPHLPAYPQVPAQHDAASMQSYNRALAAYSAAFARAQATTKAHTAAVQKLAAETHKGGKAAVAAWESLLVTAGIAVAGSDGKPVSLHGDTGSGWLTSDAELRLHSMLSASPGGMRLIDLADSWSTTLAMSKDDLANLLYNELYTISDHDFGVVFQAVGPPFFVDHKKLPVEDVVLTWAQTELIMRRLAVEIEVSSSRNGGTATSGYLTGPDAAAVTISPAVDRVRQDGHRDCVSYDKNPWGSKILDQTEKAHGQFVFDGLIEHFAKLAEEKAETGATEFFSKGRVIGLARVFLAVASLYAKATSLEATFEMPDAPLVRTKDTHPGEVRDLHITYTFNAGKWETVRACLNLLLGLAGFELPGTAPKPPSDMDVQISSDDPGILRVGDGTGKSKKVDSDQTDDNGKVSFKLSGAPQGDRIPAEAKPEDKTATIRAVNDLTSSNFFDDILSVPWDASDAAGSFGLSLIPQLIARSKFITFRDTIPVRDWKLSADFEVTAVGDVTQHLAYNELFQGCGISQLHDESVLEQGTFASDAVDITAKLISNPEGNIGDQAFVFVPRGKDFTMVDAGSGNGVLMFPLPGSYKTEKSYSTPGTWKKPTRHVEDISSCASGWGEGGSTPVDDCGVRDYKGTLQVTMPKARHLYLAGEHADAGLLWKHCGSTLYPSDPVVPPPLKNCQSLTTSGGKVPSIADVFDTSKKRLDVSGKLTCTREDEGSLSQIDYNWTLQLCRIENGKPDC